MPASSRAQPFAASGDRHVNPSSDLFAPPAHPPADMEPARRAPPATKHVTEAQASAGSMDAAHAAAGLEQLLAALQAKASSRLIHGLTNLAVDASACCC